MLKKKIPKALRLAVWSTYVGLDRGSMWCLCCKSTKIYQMNFEAGHVKAESKGGATDLANLRPICGVCNKSMGTRDMHQFIMEHGLGQKHSWLKKFLKWY